MTTAIASAPRQLTLDGYAAEVAAQERQRQERIRHQEEARQSRFEALPPPTRAAIMGARRSIDERFATFHEANPHVYRMLVAMAREAKRAGHKRYGIKGLWEALRWKTSVETQDASGFKCSNDLTSRYARAIQEQEPDLRGFFETRPLAVDR